MIKFIPGCEASLQDKILLVSALSVGSVGTITLDLLVINNQFKKIGYFNTRCLESAVGVLPKAFGNEVIGLPAELYLKGDVLILQLRAKVRKGYSFDLVKDIKKLAEENRFKEIIFAGSLTFGYSSRPDNQISSTKQNVYHFVKGNTGLKLSQQGSIQKLLHEGEEIGEYLENAGLADQANEELDNVVFFLIFANPVWDPKSALSLAQYLKRVVPYKQLSEQITRELQM